MRCTSLEFLKMPPNAVLWRRKEQEKKKIPEKLLHRLVNKTLGLIMVSTIVTES